MKAIKRWTAGLIQKSAAWLLVLTKELLEEVKAWIDQAEERLEEAAGELAEDLERWAR